MSEKIVIPPIPPHPRFNQCGANTFTFGEATKGSWDIVYLFSEARRSPIYYTDIAEDCCALAECAWRDEATKLSNTCNVSTPVEREYVKAINNAEAWRELRLSLRKDDSK